MGPCERVGALVGVGCGRRREVGLAVLVLIGPWTLMGYVTCSADCGRVVAGDAVVFGHWLGGYVGWSARRESRGSSCPFGHELASVTLGVLFQKPFRPGVPPIQLFDCLFNCFTYEKELIEEYMPSRGGPPMS